MQYSTLTARITGASRGSLRWFAASLCLLLLLASCMDKQTFRIKGEFEHLQQAELYIYSPDGGLNSIDTIEVKEGRFIWETTLTDDATFYIIYPNFSEQPVFGHPGVEVKLKADANQLKMTSLSGTEDNEDLTDFRLATANLSEEQLTATMRHYIQQYPGTSVSVLLQRQLTVRNASLSRLHKGQTLPDFVLPPDHLTEGDDTITLEKSPTLPHHTTLRNGQPLLIAFWWYQSRDINYQLHQAIERTRDYDKAHRFQALSINMDVSAATYLTLCRQDTIHWPSRCYQQGWDTPIVREFAIRTLPFYILTDDKLRIIALGSSWEDDIRTPLDRYIASRNQ